MRHLRLQRIIRSINFYIIKTGKVLIYREDKGKEILTLSSGEILGEISFFDRSNYGITAKIYSEGTVIVSISQNDFKNILMKYPWVSQNLNLIYAQRLRDLYNKLSF